MTNSKGFVKRSVKRSGTGDFSETRYTIAKMTPEQEGKIQRKREEKDREQQRPSPYINEYKKPQLKGYGEVSPTYIIGEDGIARQNND